MRTDGGDVVIVNEAESSFADIIVVRPHKLVLIQCKYYAEDTVNRHSIESEFAKMGSPAKFASQSSRGGSRRIGCGEGDAAAMATRPPSSADRGSMTAERLLLECCNDDAADIDLVFVDYANTVDADVGQAMCVGIEGGWKLPCDDDAETNVLTAKPLQAVQPAAPALQAVGGDAKAIPGADSGGDAAAGPLESRSINWQHWRVAVQQTGESRALYPLVTGSARPGRLRLVLTKMDRACTHQEQPTTYRRVDEGLRSQLRRLADAEPTVAGTASRNGSSAPASAPTSASAAG